MAKKSKNMARIYCTLPFFFFLTYNCFSLFWGTMAYSSHSSFCHCTWVRLEALDMIWLLDFSMYLWLCNYIAFAYIFKSFIFCDERTLYSESFMEWEEIYLVTFLGDILHTHTKKEVGSLLFFFFILFVKQRYFCSIAI